MTERTHRSIGEVLHLLEDEFPEVTISKIRFLESQGLLNPERTPSGYRMFFNEDIGRLKWILVQQRDNFLPLRVIKKRLDNNEWSPEEFAVTEVPAAANTFARNVEHSEVVAATPGPGTSVDDVASRMAAAAPAAAESVLATPVAPLPAAAASAEPTPVEPTNQSVASVPAVAEAPEPAPLQAAPVAAALSTSEAPETPEAVPAASTGEGETPVASVVESVVATDPVQSAPAAPAPTPVQSAPAAPAPTPVQSAPAAPAPIAAAAPTAQPQQPVDPAPVSAPAPAPEPPLQPAPPAAEVHPAPAPPAERPPQPASTMMPLHPPRNDALDSAPGLASVDAARPHALEASTAAVTFNTTELAEASGIDVATVRELQKFGIVEAVVEEPPTFDADSLMIARAAAAFMAHGLEPRHLKPFRIAAEREAGMLEQLTLPVARQKSAGASRRAVDLANELVSMGSDLRYAMLRRSLRSTLELD